MMGEYDSIIQSAAEKLLEDERLRGNLTDDEANLLINWAVGWLEGRVASTRDEAAARTAAQAEVARLRPAMQKINGLLADDKSPTMPEAARTLGVPAPPPAAQDVPDRQAVIRALTDQLSETWRKQ
jgi:hypothetical protein